MPQLYDEDRFYDPRRGAPPPAPMPAAGPRGMDFGLPLDFDFNAGRGMMYADWPGPGGGGDVSGTGTGWEGGGDGRRGGGDPGAGASPLFNFGAVPKYTPPNFTAPTLADAMNEPGYQMRLNAGTDALNRSAAARGVLRTGKTLTDVIEYGQDFGAQEYDRVFQRALAAHGARSEASRNAFAPLMAQWQFLSQAELARALAQFNAAQRGGGGGGGGDREVYDPEPERPQYPRFYYS